MWLYGNEIVVPGLLENADSRRRKVTLFGERLAMRGRHHHSHHYSIVQQRYGRSNTRLFAACDDESIEQRLSDIEKVAGQLLNNYFLSQPSKDEKSDSMSVERRATLQAAIRKVEEGLVERNEEAKLLLLTALCREHLLLLGPPGTGSRFYPI